MTDRLAICGDLLDFTADPGFEAVDPAPGANRTGTANAAVRFDPDHWLLVEGGRIVGRSAHEPGPDWRKQDHRGRVVMPGFIDTHVHSPQLEVMASYGTGLLDWLETYTFPAEARYADAQHASDGAARFLDALLAHGTTAVVAFATVHAVAANALFAAAQARGMRLITGKVLMDRHAPDNLRDDVAIARAECIDLINRWHGNDRLAYAVTVRFAPTSSDAQLSMAGELLASRPGLYMQTHLAETQDEVAWVQTLFPLARSYLDAYHQHGLLNERAVLAHGIWLDDADRALLAATGAHIAHSPSSNLFLGSGLMDWRALHAAGAGVSLATDVGGGTSLCMLRTLAEAYKVQAMQGHKLSAWKALYTATRGAATLLHLGGEVGSFDVGCAADITVWHWAVGHVAQHRDTQARSLHERVFAWMTLGDERNLVASLVSGQARYRR